MTLSALCFSVMSAGDPMELLSPSIRPGRELAVRGSTGKGSGEGRRQGEMEELVRKTEY